MRVEGDYHRASPSLPGIPNRSVDHRLMSQVDAVKHTDSEMRWPGIRARSSILPRSFIIYQ
jgi:hypothetical protein